MFTCSHDDVIKWKHFPRYWPFVRGIHRSPVNSPHKGQWRGALMFSLICVLINGWVNNREAGDLRHHRGHYDVMVMTQDFLYIETRLSIFPRLGGTLISFPKLNTMIRVHGIYEPSEIPFIFLTFSFIFLFSDMFGYSKSYAIPQWLKSMDAYYMCL